MYKAKRIRDYVPVIARKHGLTNAQVNQILLFGWRNIIRMIENKEDVRLTGIGRLWIDKPYRTNPKKKKWATSRS